MPSNATKKTPLGDITHRTLTGRRSNNTTTQQVINLSCSAGPGEENSPARGLLEIFASGSIGRKRTLKLAIDDNENIHPTSIFPSPSLDNLKPSSSNIVTTATSTISSSSCRVTLPDFPTKSKFPLSHNSIQPLNLTRSLCRRQTFGRVRNRPSYFSTRFQMLDYISRPKDVYTFVSQDETTLVPPFSCAYNNAANRARNLAVGDEDGTIHIVDTRNDDVGTTTQILAHLNAVFDLCWTSDDSKLISASGDKSAKLHDVETKTCISTFMGHTGSLKSLSLKSGSDNVFASAGRDGSILIWDVRCSSTTSANGETTHRPADKIVNAHASSTRTVPPKKTKNGSDGPNTASAVQYMIHNDNILASAGALDGSVKYWDVRKHGTYFKHDLPTPLQASTYTPITKRAHGMTSLALSPDGRSLFAVSSDNQVYMYNATSLGSPVECFGGNNFLCSSYYIKISVSPDNNYIAAGSCKGLYVWEVNRPDRKPLVFQGHEKEVTAVDWAKDLGNGTQLAGCSDDATVRTWRANKELAEECRNNQSLQVSHGMVSE